jgi:hypothetical protein
MWRFQFSSTTSTGFSSAVEERISTTRSPFRTERDRVAGAPVRHGRVRGPFAIFGLPWEGPIKTLQVAGRNCVGLLFRRVACSSSCRLFGNFYRPSTDPD